MNAVLGAVQVALAVAAIPMAAEVFSISDVDAAFLNAVPAITINNADPNHITVRWGTPVGAGQSGYNFDSLVPPVIVGNVPPTTAWFQLGNFTHLNQPVTGTFLSSIDLVIVLDFMIGATPFNNVAFSYTLNQNETTNAPPCPSFQESAVPCDDQVIVSPPSAGVFDVGGTLFTLELGFSKDGGTTIIDNFVTTEGIDNVAGIYGRFSSEVSDVVVPEPAPIGLVSVALAGLFVALRRRKSS